MTTEERLTELIAKDEIRTLLIAYCHGSDRKDHALVESVFHPDAVLDYGYFSGGPKDLTAFSTPFLAKFTGTHHSLTNIVIRVEGDEASSLSYITAIHSQRQSRSGPKDMIGYGRYVDRLERRESTWRIAHRKVLFDWTIEVPSNFAWPEGMAESCGRRSLSDPAYQIIPSV